MSCDYLDRDLDRYVDRELDATTDAAVQAHLATCRGCRERVAERHALTGLIRAARYYETPPALRARVAAGASRGRSWPKLLVWAAAAALVVAGSGSAALVHWRAGNDAIFAEVVNGHVRSLIDDHLFDVRSTDQHTVKPWFAGRLDFSPPVVDLSASGFPLIGGRVDALDGRAVATLVYQRRQHVINVFIEPAEANEATRSATRTLRGFHVRRWVANGMAFWAVSDLNESELGVFVLALQGS
jgi:anti-sigma factor RsiW